MPYHGSMGYQCHHPPRLELQEEKLDHDRSLYAARSIIIYSEPSPCLMLESFRETRMGNSACAYLQTTSSGAAPVLVCSKPRTNHCCPVGLHGYDLGRSHSSLAVFSINGREDCQLYGEIWSLQTCCWILGQGDMKLPLQHGEVECVCERERGRRTKEEELSRQTRCCCGVPSFDTSACCWVEF